MLGGIFATLRQISIPVATANACCTACSPKASSLRLGTLKTNLRNGRRGSSFLLLSSLKLYNVARAASTAWRTFQ